MKHNFEISIEAIDAKEAEMKLKAAATLMAKLKTNELSKLADVVKNDPAKTALAKQYLGL